MDLMKKYDQKAAALSISQFDPPRCFELAGKRFEFVIDTGEETGDAVLNFVDETTVEWSIKGGDTLKADKYGAARQRLDIPCLLLHCRQTPRENHTWVIDKEQMLVTFLRCSWVRTPINVPLRATSFGYIKEEGKPHTDLRRHGFTDDP